MRRNKYNASTIEWEGEVFDSRKEMRRYQTLRLAQETGVITDLQRQVKYILIPAQREPDIIGPKGGVKKGKVLERELAYVADFVYTMNGETVVEDVKGYRNPKSGAYGTFVIKRKLMLWVHGIRIKEV